jgi:hypothetical protein
VRAFLTLGCAALAVAAALAPVPPPVVDRWFWMGVYPPTQRVVTSLTNLVPFALFDLVLVGALLAVLVIVGRTGRAIRRRQLRGAGTSLAALVLLASVLYLWFAGLWGFNYRKSPIEAIIAIRRGPADTRAVLALGRRAVESVNALYAPPPIGVAARPEWDNQILRASFAATLTRVGRTSRVEPGRLKHSLIGPYFRWTGVDGMISPFTLEVLSNPDLLPYERPFVAAHEWSHLAGYADEAEASFVGWLSCVNADRPSRYSAWLFLVWQIRAEVSATDRTALDKALAAGPRADMAAIAERLRRGAAPRLQRASWAAYDSYLKANRVEAGVGSYSRVIELLTKAEFEGEWRPVTRAAHRE